MFELIQMGGPIFTYPLTLLLLAILGLIAVTAMKGDSRHRSLLLHLGVFSAVWGILGQAMGLYQAMGVIEQVGGISPQMLAGGIKVSFVTTLFGLVNLVIALAGWTILGYRKGA
jgi:flagellar motor component MotA